MYIHRYLALPILNTSCAVTSELWKSAYRALSGSIVVCVLFTLNCTFVLHNQCVLKAPKITKTSAGTIKKKRAFSNCPKRTIFA
jgi:hypothetical protein